MCVFRICSYDMLFCSCDLDLDPMTFIKELDLDILKMCLLTKNEASRLRLSKVRTQTGQTDRHRQTRSSTLLATFTGAKVGDLRLGGARCNPVSVVLKIMAGEWRLIIMLGHYLRQWIDSCWQTSRNQAYLSVCWMPLLCHHPRCGVGYCISKPTVMASFMHWTVSLDLACCCCCCFVAWPCCWSWRCK